MAGNEATIQQVNDVQMSCSGDNFPGLLPPLTTIVGEVHPNVFLRNQRGTFNQQATSVLSPLDNATRYRTKPVVGDLMKTLDDLSPKCPINIIKELLDVLDESLNQVGNWITPTGTALSHNEKESKLQKTPKGAEHHSPSEKSAAVRTSEVDDALEDKNKENEEESSNHNTNIFNIASIEQSLT
ncbi:unnamed protein product [Lepeophtheirus salmonis]|uniref:(salmon louse) hypothetical protein n=1 Tax=Lepeophtheirus salmonis TaxID=72036 RepID=A0A7R8CG72_LEPSM|nr:unnamed protein product [Lepeophtheirus salmonis]CAF2773257.1 unnamed protein product [Lepeophtheirus salmonis]